MLPLRQAANQRDAVYAQNVAPHRNATQYTVSHRTAPQPV